MLLRIGCESLNSRAFGAEQGTGINAVGVGLNKKGSVGWAEWDGTGF